MKVIRIEGYGSFDQLRYETVEQPEPNAYEVLIRQLFAGVNFADIYMRNGLYRGQHTYGTSLPFILGLEGVGTVVAVGSEVQHIKLGMRVGYCLAPGGYAEYVAVAAQKVVQIPAWCPSDQAAAIMLQGATSHYLTHSLFELKAGHYCLIHAGAGGVGQLLIQIAKARGANVLTTVGSDQKVDLVKALGADHVILYRHEDVRAKVMELTEGRGVDVVYDSVGKDTIQTSMKCLKVRGTCALFGASSGVVEAVTPMEMAEAGSIFFTRPHLAHYRQTAAEAQWRADDLFELLKSKQLQVAIDHVFALADAALAHKRLESRQSIGKILLNLE